MPLTLPPLPPPPRLAAFRLSSLQLLPLDAQLRAAAFCCWLLGQGCRGLADLSPELEMVPYTAGPAAVRAKGATLVPTPGPALDHVLRSSVPCPGQASRAACGWRRGGAARLGQRRRSLSLCPPHPERACSWASTFPPRPRFCRTWPAPSRRTPRTRCCHWWPANAGCCCGRATGGRVQSAGKCRLGGGATVLLLCFGIDIHSVRLVSTPALADWRRSCSLPP